MSGWPRIDERGEMLRSEMLPSDLPRIDLPSRAEVREWLLAHPAHLWDRSSTWWGNCPIACTLQEVHPGNSYHSMNRWKLNFITAFDASLEAAGQLSAADAAVILEGALE